MKIIANGAKLVGTDEVTSQEVDSEVLMSWFQTGDYVSPWRVCVDPGNLKGKEAQLFLPELKHGAWYAVREVLPEDWEFEHEIVVLAHEDWIHDAETPFDLFRCQGRIENYHMTMYSLPEGLEIVIRNPGTRWQVVMHAAEKGSLYVTTVTKDGSIVAVKVEVTRKRGTAHT